MPPGPDPEKKPEMKEPRQPPPRPPQRPGQRPVQPPQRKPLPPRPPPRARKHRHGKASHARIGLVVIFVLLRLLDFMFLVNAAPEFYRALLASVITGAIWTTALLIAIALRKSWARLILLALFGLATVSVVISLPLAFDLPHLWTPLVASLFVSAGSFAWLCYSRDVHRLTGRARD